MNQYDLLLLAFIGSIMAQTGCGRDEAVKRIAALCMLTEQQIGIKVELTNA